MYVYIYIYVCMYVCVCIYIYIYIHTYMYAQRFHATFQNVRLGSASSTCVCPFVSFVVLFHAFVCAYLSLHFIRLVSLSLLFCFQHLPLPFRPPPDLVWPMRSRSGTGLNDPAFARLPFTLLPFQKQSPHRRQAEMFIQIMLNKNI